MTSDFNEAVASWMRSEGRDVVSVTSVEGCGSDWLGDTDAGFHDEFYATIKFTDSGGRASFDDIRGEDMESLWRHVVTAWPSDA